MTDIKKTSAADTDWWRGAVIYQIYPRSYQDSNGDGIGDIPGIIKRLPYIARLGVDCIWISPFFTSPMLDFGYDVSNYRDIDPMFGTLADFDQLITEAHERGLKVMIDLVLSHTSTEHPWFKESRANRSNPKANWYVWADPKPDGTPPNNWLSIFGGSAWEWDSGRMQYYLHNFLIEQADLNFHEPQVQEALLDVARFWLDRGVDGFRLDTVNFYVHDKYLRDNPPLAPEEINDKTAPKVNPYNFQNHLFDKSRPENLDFLRKLRRVMNEYKGITSVGEVGESQRGAEVQAEYTSGGDKLHMCYDFALLSNELPTGRYVASVLETFDALSSDGWACWAYSNHDVVRHKTRWDLTPTRQRLYAALLMALKGTACIYQGEELGLTESEVAFEDLQDPYGKRFWPKFKGRDGCRTPMVWDREEKNCGFSEGKPWLPVSTGHMRLSAAAEDRDPNSTLNFYRRIIALRKALLPLQKGSFTPLMVEEDFLTFLREYKGSRVFCAFNLADEARRIELPAGNWAQVPGAPFNSTIEAGRATLPPYQAVFATARDA
ncbi:alpha-glucosidase family protein [Aliiruegeria lutimaris]|uniref:Alpha-glucosidase n=1 Tax=Aliiruegeria lutimaris TaxID=571298 RepID=A0A1G9EMD7_9RHOB|nr:alpha-glucosidase family protein [Aliiruegeria lutimaris]SDK77211.1 alpha-glucosidase [Aliiruegeria lutimaris]